MICSIPSYINKTQLSDTEKDRLATIHNNVFKKAKESGSFRQFEGKLYTLKNNYQLGVSFINSTNKEYNSQIAKLNTKSPGQHYFSLNVLPLSVEKQGELFLQQNTQNPLKNELRSIIEGQGTEDGNLIKTTQNYLRANEEAGKRVSDKDYPKQQEAKDLEDYIDKNNLWYKEELSNDRRLPNEGVEQYVYGFPEEGVVRKSTDSIFYTSWKDYLNNLLIHNYFFPETGYKLL